MATATKNTDVPNPVPDTDIDDFVRKPDPFMNMRIADNGFLADMSDRQPCPRCNASRMFFCYSCYIPLPGVPAFPEVRFPVKIDIIKHRKEIDGKSTSVHARLLAPHDCRIFEYPDIPDYAAEPGVILIYPSHRSRNVQSLFTGVQQLDTGNNFGLPDGHQLGTLLRFRLREFTVANATDDIQSDDRPAHLHTYDLSNLPVKRAVFIDSTWNQSRSVYKDPRISRLPCVVLQNRLSQFWRHQKNSPRWYLSTVEAIHQFLLEVHVHAWGLDRAYRGLDHLEIGGPFVGDGLCRDVDADADADAEADNANATMMRPYNGQYDNLLFLFTHMYGMIHRYYDHNSLKAYKRPIT